MLADKFRDLPLKSKIEILILCCVLFTSTIAFFSIHYISNAYDHVLYQSISSNLSYSSSEVYSYLQETEELANMILGNHTIQTQLPTIANADSVREKQAGENSVYSILRIICLTLPHSISLIFPFFRKTVRSARMRSVLTKSLWKLKMIW